MLQEVKGRLVGEGQTAEVGQKFERLGRTQNVGMGQKIGQRICGAGDVRVGQAVSAM